MSVSGLGLLSLLKDTDKPWVGLEIGVYNGNNSYNLLSNYPNLILHGVDPYTEFTDWNGRVTHGAQDPDQPEYYMQQALKPFGARFILHRTTSDEAVHHFSDYSLDFIFIDGLHTYEQVLKDCRNYYSKVKKGGIFSGHDYDNIAGVRQAVDEFAATVGKAVLRMPSFAWYWITD
jgi:hypothetical protein